MDNSTVAAAQVIISIIPIVGIVMGSVVVFFFLLWSHRRRLRMIERGLVPASHFDIDAFSLLAGLVNLAVGGVISLFFLIKEGFSYGLLGGLIPLSVGLSLIAFFFIRRRL